MAVSYGVKLLGIRTLTDIDLKDLKKAFGTMAVSRGRLLTLGEKVMRVSSSHSGDSISGVVLDDNDRPQRPHITMRVDGDSCELDSRCTCGAARPCEHAAAVVLEWLAGATRAESAAEEVLPSWLQWLESFPQSPSEGRRHEVIFLLDIRSSAIGEVPVLLAVEARRDETGAIAEGHLIDLDPDRNEAVPAGCTEVERRLLRLLREHGNRRLGSGIQALTGHNGSMVLGQLLQSGRLFWRNDLSQPLKRSASRPAHFEWTLQSNGQQALRPVIDRGQSEHLTVLPLQPLLVVDTEAHTLGELHHKLPAGFLDRVLQAPLLSLEEAKDFAQRLQESATPLVSRAVPEPWIGQQVDRALSPVPVIKLSRGNPVQLADPFLRRDELAANGLHVELMFQYGEHCVSAVDPSAVLAWREGEDLCIAERDSQAESQILGSMRESGLKELELPPDLRVCDRRSVWQPTQDTEMEALEGVLEVADQRVKKGWRFESDDALVGFHPVADPKWAVEIKRDGDGFAMHIALAMGDERIPLLDALAQGLDQDGPILDLPGSDVPYALRRSEVSSLSVILPELGRKSAVRDSWLQLPLHAVGRLLELEKLFGDAIASFEGAEDLRQLAHELYQDQDSLPVLLPPGMTLRPYQQVGVRWMHRLHRLGFGGILADDMGLGKTVQTLALLRLQRQDPKHKKIPDILIAPTSLINNWCTEADRFAPDLKIVVLRSGDRTQQYLELDQADLVITTYALLLRDRDLLAERAFGCAFFDEAQAVKNPQAKITRAANALKAQRKFCLTGTPMENHLGELWSLTELVCPGLLGPYPQFQRAIQAPIEAGDAKARDALHLRLAPFILRRTKDQVLKELPPKTTIVQSIELSSGQRALYDKVRRTLFAELKQKAEEGKLSHLNALDALLKLRQICCDPRLPKLGQKASAAESAKLQWLRDTVAQLVAEKRRILIFSQFTQMLAMIKDELESLGIDYRLLTGSTVDRATPVDDFQAGRVPVFLMSLKAGGTGLNLTAADTVIHYDPWWNPAAEQQASDRAHRIGQESAVFIYKLIAADTVEQRVLALQEQKRKMIEDLPSSSAAEMATLNAEDLLRLVA